MLSNSPKYKKETLRLSESLPEPQRLTKFKSSQEIGIPKLETPEALNIDERLSRAKLKVESNFELYKNPFYKQNSGILKNKNMLSDKESSNSNSQFFPMISPKQST